MIKKIFSNVFPSRSRKIIKKYQNVLEKVNSFEEELMNYTDEKLKQQTGKFKELLSKGKTLEDILPEAFATVRETSRRTLNMRHYDVQIIGGIALHEGFVAEMKTGEGKTLVATLPSYLNSLSGNPVHLVTVNEYLAQRDHDWMSKIHRFLNLKTAAVVSNMSKEEKQKAYSSDVIYVTNSELGFDYLKDNMISNKNDLILINRGLHYCIIDEIDSILIDEARTPLIISGPSHNSSDLYEKINAIVKLLPSSAYELEEKNQSVQLTEQGNEDIEKILQEKNMIPKNESIYDINNYHFINHILQSLKAHNALKKDKDYIVRDGEVLLIDEFTGRIMDGRRYSGGLHQAIEAKEKLKIKNENQTLASITYQNLFRLYKKLSGMTGTALTEENEFYDIYKLQVLEIPTHKPVIRKDNNDLIFTSEKYKFDNIIKLIKDRHKIGQPILIGTAGIDKSEKLSSLLKREGIKHNVLNAKHHAKEATIIAEAGRKKAVTIATNMAGRGTDIILGGNPDEEILAAIKNIKEKEEIERITNEIKEERYKEKEEILKLGGLLVIGSARHESRRIDNQLRGRSGRLGDPGESFFFLSLQDDLLRIFGGEKIESILSKVGFKEDENLNHPLLNRVVFNSQKKLENFHYDIRKNVLRYDDIVNEQRTFVYERRNKFLHIKDHDSIVLGIIEEVNNKIFTSSLEEGSINEETLNHLLSENYGIYTHKQIESKINHNNSQETNQNLINDLVFEVYKNKFNALDKELKAFLVSKILLDTIDECWKKHLSNLTHVREAIYLRAYAQKDPLSEFRIESFELFESMFDEFDYLSINRLLNIKLEFNDTISGTTEQVKKDQELTKSFDDMFLQPQKNIESDKYQNVGRNEPCPCNSGKKYKQCHGK